MPPGRFVCATTDTPVGPITFIAICIPWSHAHVTSGQKNRKAWEEHHRFLDGLELFLSSSVFETPVVLLGDFNQRVPRKRSPITAYNRLMEVTGKQFSFLTSGHIATENALSIDHVCVSSALSGQLVRTFPKQTPDGINLSDHFGLALNLFQTRRPAIDENGAPGET